MLTVSVRTWFLSEQSSALDCLGAQKCCKMATDRENNLCKIRAAAACQDVMVGHRQLLLSLPGSLGSPDPPLCSIRHLSQRGSGTVPVPPSLREKQRVILLMHCAAVGHRASRESQQRK